MKNKNYLFYLFVFSAFVFNSNSSYAQKINDAGNPIITGTHSINTSNIKRPQSGCDSAKTTFQAGNGHNGIMFDIVADSTIYITDFDVLTINAAVTDTLHMFYKKGSCRGYTSIPSAWTKADSLPVSLKGTGSVDTLVHINSQLNYNMVAGDTLAIYFTYKSVNVAYTNGTFLDSVYRKKSTITILQDYGVAYKFGSTFMPRVFNGVVHFCDGTALGINEVTKTESALFPNPMISRSVLTISNEINLANARLVVSDISGRIVRTQEHITSHNIGIDKGNLGNGMYFYSLTENNKIIASGKLVIIQ